MSRATRQTWLAAAAGVASMLSSPLPASAEAPQDQSFEGTLQFCETACGLGALDASGPIDGTAT